MEEVTIITKQAGEFFTASAFIGGCFAGSATCSDKRLAAEQARAYAQTLADAGQLLPLDQTAARLGAAVSVPRFGVAVRCSQLRQAVVLAAQVAALAVPMAGPAPLPVAA